MNRTKHLGGEIAMIKQKLKQEREPDMFKNQWMADHPGRSDEDFERWKRWAEEDYFGDDDDCIDYFIEECEEVWDGGICTIAARQANISLAQAQAILAEEGRPLGKPAFPPKPHLRALPTPDTSRQRPSARRTAAEGKSGTRLTTIPASSRSRPPSKNAPTKWHLSRRRRRPPEGPR